MANNLQASEMITLPSGRRIYPRGDIKNALLSLKAGESADFTILRLPTVRSMASILGVMYNREFKTQILRYEGIIRVYRLS